MTLENNNLFDPLMEDPWTGPNLMSTQEREELDAQQEQVRQRLVAAHSSNPLYQARAEKDPEYWNKFYLGQIS